MKNTTYSGKAEAGAPSAPLLGPRFIAALQLAHDLHREQARKGTAIPYIAHLMATAAIALEYGADEDQAIAALLHDAPEDQGGRETLELIAARFGAGVGAIVEGCTDAFESPKPPWRARKERYVEHIPSASASVALVSAADKLHNARAILSDLRALGPALWDRFTGGRDGMLWYYRSLVAAFRAGLAPRTLVDELVRTVEAIVELAETGS